MKKCKQYRNEFDESGAAPGAEARAHLQDCAGCRAFYEEQAKVARLVGELSRVSAPNDFEFRLRARLAAAESAGRPSLLRRSFVPGAVSITLAAVFALAVTLSLRPGQRPDAGQSVARGGEAAPPSTAALPSTTSRESGQQVANNSKPEINSSGAGAQTDGRRAAEGLSGASPYRRRLVAAANVSNPGSKSRKNRMVTTEFSVSGAPTIGTASQPSVEVAQAEATFAVPLQTSSQPLKVVLSDEHGTPRVVPVKSVSFGSQQLVGQLNGQQPGALEPKEGVW